MRHFISTLDWSRADLEQILTSAAAHKKERGSELRRKDLLGKTIALVFFNPSLRTRTSFEVGIFELGGHAVVLEPGKGAWPIEFKDGMVMDGEADEHVEEVARVLSRYCDIIAVRTFPKFQSWSGDREDAVIESFSDLAAVFSNRAEAARKESDSLTMLRDTLLPKLISGELRLADVNGILSRATA